MANPTNPGHPGEYLVALASIMPVATSVDPASVYIQKGLDALAGGFPALILNCPRTHRMRKANHGKQAIFTVHGMYLDQWETSQRTYEEILADMTDALHTMADNIDANPTLGLGATIAGETIDIIVDSPVDNSQLGTPLVAGEITIQVKGVWYTAT